MAKGNRPTKKQAKPIPEIPDLGKLHKPRKGNRRAAKLIESGVRLWDQRHIERRARRRALARYEDQKRRREASLVVQDFVSKLLAACPHWKAVSGPSHIAPQNDSDVRVKELIEGAQGLTLRNPGGHTVFFRIAGLTYREHIQLRAVLPAGISSAYSYHERTATKENFQDFDFHSFDPRES